MSDTTTTTPDLVYSVTVPAALVPMLEGAFERKGRVNGAVYVPNVPDPSWTPTIANPAHATDATQPETIPNPEPQGQVPNPVTPKQWVEQCVESFVRDIIAADAHEQAQAAARAQTDATLATVPALTFSS